MCVKPIKEEKVNTLDELFMRLHEIFKGKGEKTTDGKKQRKEDNRENC